MPLFLVLFISSLFLFWLSVKVCNERFLISAAFNASSVTLSLFPHSPFFDFHLFLWTSLLCMFSKHSSTSEISGETPEAHSSSLCRLVKSFFRTLNRSRTDLCETLNKILSSFWPFKLSAIFSQTRPRSGLPLFC